ncbi:sensor histidine kinase [Thermostaphylospora chromogena]|uniref:sensor histidine kinase n=1 Tax=Thermostaphylospora chromogena TaxID=35622 RepID=UPI0013F64667|nr:histidine kinase [Thermostaphylospora chromogena]
MRRLLAGLVVAAELALLVGAYRGDPPPWAAVAYPAAVIALIAVQRRVPVQAFAAALGLATLTGAGFVLLLWASYQTGRVVVSRRGAGAVIAVALVSLAVRLPGGHPGSLIASHLVFVALPLLAGRYVAQHERLVTALEAGNRRLRRERELLAERERLRERLRIARDMHDSLGHRLGLVSIQAAALEVAPLPPDQAAAVRRLAAAARDAVDELHELVGALRGADEDPLGRTAGGGAAKIADLVAEYRAAGVPVALHRRGEPRALSPAADRAAYRVVEEGLTNAARHAPGRPVTVTLGWEPDALLIDVVNPLPAGPGEAPDPGRCHGLRGLRERVAPIGGLVDHRRTGETFRLFAMLPLAASGDQEEPAAVGGAAPQPQGAARRDPSLRVVGAAIATLLFVLLPGAMMLGSGG